MKLFRDKYADSDFHQNRHTIVIPLDTFVLTGIIALFVIVISFSLGVKRGRKLSNKILAASKAEVPANTNNINPSVDKSFNNKIKAAENKNENQGHKKLNSNNTNNNTNNDNSDGKEKKYVIQVASYSKENIAKQEKKHLESKGFSAEILRSKKNRYLVLYVGKFATREEAKKAKILLKKRYNDCFIRRL